MLDYIILPAIMQDQKPVNAWGAPLYPKDSTGLEKAGYAARSFGETVVPSSIGALSSFGLSDDQLQYLPSYPGRKLGFATRGKTSVGVIGKESAASRGMRSALSLAGINLYPVDLTNVAAEIKKKSK
jgi:hypothetical protein